MYFYSLGEIHVTRSYSEGRTRRRVQRVESTDNFNVEIIFQIFCRRKQRKRESYRLEFWYNYKTDTIASFYIWEYDDCNVISKEERKIYKKYLINK